MAALEQAAALVSALIERDPDLAIFQVVRQDVRGSALYGVSHSMHTAIAARLAGSRLGWDKAAMSTVFKAALTMNLSMLELQGRLALQPTPLTAHQRETIRLHPTRSVEMLQAAGVNDADWLRAVAEHHESADGKGYPAHLTEVCEMAALIRRADIYTAKLSARATRAPMKAHEAARVMFLQDEGHPMVAALVKEFGIYPPGCCVRLASGEVGLVVKRGPSSNTPVVAVVLNKKGEPMMEPMRRATGTSENAVVDVLNEKSLKVRVSREQLATMGHG
jgi:HD-GYP domain-containing protein (c-di-GMP phosphodiesterase class II)